MLNTLCNEPVNHAPSVHLPTSINAYRKLGAHLAAISQMPFRCCHNCGMMNYPASGDRILVRASGLDDLRAWRVYGSMVEHFCQQQHIDRGEFFLCEEAPNHPSDGHRRAPPCVRVHRVQERDVPRSHAV
eukprot:12739-Prymnesium_polylepis.1